MEATNALLASLVQTKSIERVLAPIASQVSQLIILNEAFEKGDRNAFSLDHLPDATIVQSATVGLVGTVKKIAADSTDEEFKKDTTLACDLLIIAGENLVSATDRVRTENFSHESRRHLVRMSKDVLEGTMKVLLVADDAEVRKIIRSAKNVTERLALLSAISSMKHLVSGFKGFTESVMLLCGLADRRQHQLTHPQQRERIIAAMTTLRKSVPMLSSALQTYAKYPNNAQAKASKEYMLAQTLGSLTELIHAVENKPSVDEEAEDVDEPGHFITKIDQLLDWLSSGQRLDIADSSSEFDLLMEAVIRHSMAVAHISHELQRELIIKASQRVLKQSNLTKHCATSLIEDADNRQLSADFDSQCEILMDEFQDLERHVNNATLQLYVDVFKETTEPLDRMVKVALTLDYERNDLDSYMDAFNSHSDLMCQVARFIAASSPDGRRVRVIRSCISQLEKLDPEMAPAVLSSSQDPRDKGSLEHLRLLKREWSNEVVALTRALDDIIDPAMFIQVSESQVCENVQELKGSLYDNNANVVMDTTRALCGRARRVVTIATHIVDNHDDPIFRNGLLVYINRLNKVIPAVKVASGHLVEDLGSLKQHEKLHKRSMELMDCVTHMQEGLSSHNHLHLLSPERDNVRPIKGLKALGIDMDSFPVHAGMYGDHEGPTAPKTVTNAEKPALQERPSEIDYKSFVLDVLDSHVSQLSKELVTAAVAARRSAVDLLSNDILCRTNHITDVATVVAAHCDGETSREALKEFSSNLTSLTPKLLTSCIKVTEGEVDHVELLHETANEWASLVSRLEYLVDGILDKWKSVVNKVVDAAKVGDIPLLMSETKYMNEHRRSVSHLVSMAAESFSQSDALSQEQVRIVEEAFREFESQHAMICVISDVISKATDTSEHMQLELTGREWATKLFNIVSTSDRLAHQTLERVKGCSSSSRMIGSPLTHSLEVRQFVRDTIVLKAQVNQMLSGRTDPETEQVFRLLDDLDLLNAAMNDLDKVIPCSAAIFLSTENMYATHKLLLIKCQWITKAETIRKLVDAMTSELCAPLDRLMNIAMATTSDAKASEEKIESLNSIQAGFSRMVMSARTKAMDTIHTSSDLNNNRLIRQSLDDLTKVTDEVKMAAQVLADNSSEENVAAFEACKREWVGTVQGLLSKLDAMEGVDANAKAELSRILRNPSKSVTFSSLTFNQSTADPSTLTSDLTQIGGNSLKNKSNMSAEPMTDNPVSLNIGQSVSPSVQPKAALKPDANLTSVVKTTPYGVTFKARGNVDKTNMAASKVEDLIVPQGSERLMSSPKSGATSSSSHVTTNPGHGGSYLDQSPVQHRQPERRTSTNPFTTTSRSIAAAALNLQQEAEKWEDDKNPIVRVAKEMSRMMYNMAEYTRGEGPITNKDDMIKAAKEVANKGKEIVKFATILCEYCVDKRFSKDLMFYANHIPTISTQLNIISSVKAATPEDRTAEKVLVKNAENLMEAVVKTLKSAEATCVKGLKQPPSDAQEDVQAVVLAMHWKRRLVRHRWMQARQADTDDLGLRRIEKHASQPMLSQIVLRR